MRSSLHFLSPSLCITLIISLFLSFLFFSFILSIFQPLFLVRVYLLLPTFHLAHLLFSNSFTSLLSCLLPYFKSSHCFFRLYFSYFLLFLAPFPQIFLLIPSFFSYFFVCLFLSLMSPFVSLLLTFQFSSPCFLPLFIQFLSFLSFLLPSFKYLSFVSVSYSLLSWFLYFFLVFFASFLQIFPFFLFLPYCILHEYYACQDYRELQLAF